MAQILITKNKEDYLHEMYSLHLLKNSSIRSVDLSKSLKVSRPSVFEMLKKLLKENLINMDSKKNIALTKDGINAARKINRKHRILEVFFNEVLELKDKFHNEAHKLEHVLSDEVTDKLELFLKNPKICPDGNIIPSKTSKICELSKLKENIPSRFIFFFGDDSYSDFLKDNNIFPNSKIELIKLRKKFVAIINNKKMYLPNDLASNIYVEYE